MISRTWKLEIFPQTWNFMFGAPLRASIINLSKLELSALYSSTFYEQANQYDVLLMHDNSVIGVGVSIRMWLLDTLVANCHIGFGMVPDLKLYAWVLLP